MKEIYKRSENARIWIKYCVFPTFVPVVISIMIDCYIGYTIFQGIKRHYVDIILIFFALAVSMFSSAVSMDAHGEKRRDYIGISGIGGVGYAVFYVLFYAVPDGRLWVKIFACIFVFFTGCIIIGKGMEVEEELEKEALKKQISITATVNNP